MGRGGGARAVTPVRGEIWWGERPEIGLRPVVVLSRNLTIEARRRVLVAPCTTTIRGLATEVELDPRVDPVARTCAVNMDSLESLSVGHLVGRIGALSAQRMRQLCAALAIAVDC